MAINTLRKQGGGTEETFRAQSNVDNALKGILGSEISNGVLLENISITTAGVSIEHKLNREYRGYLICKNDTFNSIKATTDSNKKLFINLQATVDCTVSLWVF